MDVKIERKKKMALYDHYASLPIEDRLVLRNRMIEKTGMGYVTFYAKLKKNSFRPLEKELFIKLLTKIKGGLK